MRQIDMHGKRLKEAEDLFYELLNEVRIRRGTLEVMFITGIGVIHDMLKESAANQGLNCYVPMANPGCLVIEFE